MGPAPVGHRAGGGRPTERPRKLYKIGELIERSGLSRQTLHNYTMLGLIEAASRTPGDHRLYAEETFDLLERIKQLRKTHTLMEIKDLLKRTRRGGER